jgi:hypothetical protein
MDIKPVGQLKPVNNGVKPVGQLKPVQSNLSPIGQLQAGDANTILPTYTTPQDLAVDSSIELLKQRGGRNGSTVLDSEWDVLKDVLKDTRATKEQREKAILTIQGYDAKHDDNNTMYYNKLEDNGVYVPTALAYGEKPPKGYKVASVWGNQKEAEDDSWYTDLGKSLGNGVMGAVQGVFDLAQVGTTLVTGEESSYLNKLGNTAEALKFKKDSDLETPILNTEGITQWSDILDKDRFDLSPKALWGTLNMAAESLTEFGLGTKGATAILKNSPKAAIFVGSFMSQLGDNLDNAEEAGLKGRDKAAVASAITAPMAALDSFFGLDGKLMSQVFQNEKRELLKTVIKEVEKDAIGNITENGFKQLTKQMTVGYSELAKRGVKGIVKDVLGEGGQEAAQDFTQKAGEQLWDKLTPDERGQFGTDAFDAKSFGDYINSFATGLVSGAPMALGTQILRSKHDEQSINAYERVKQGPEAIKALKVDLDNALKNNDINQPEYEQAMFKIDAYSKYNEETKGVNLKPENEKKAFELSFQIQGLKTEIPTNENEISKLDPIARAKVESKQKQAKELQSELNDIIRQGEIKGEPVIPKKEEERIQKEKEKEIKVEETNSKLSQEKEVEKAKTRQPDIEGLGKEKVITYPKLENKPYWKDDKRTYEEIDTEEFNNPSTDARTIHRVVRKEAYNKPNRKLFGNLTKRLYSYVNDEGDRMKGDVIEVTMEDGKKIRVASSKQEFKDENDRAVRWDDIFRRYFRSERTQGNEEGLPVGIRAVDLNNPLNEDRGPDYKPGKIALKVFDARTGKFLSWAKETKTGSAESLDKAGNELYTAEQKDLLKTLEQQMYNETPEGGDVIERLTKPKPKPTPTEKAKVATEKIVEEGKAKVAEQKASIPLTITKAVKQQLYDLGYSKVNVNNMKPERALDIINKQEGKPKEVISEKESTEKESGGINSQGLLKLAYNYNSLSKNKKKSEAGVNLFRKIQDKANELDLIFELYGDGKISLYNKKKSGDKGKKIVTPGVKINPDVIQKEKDAIEEYKAAKRMPANDIYHAIALDVVNGTTFDLDEFRRLTDGNIPIGDKFLFNGKKTVKFDDYADHLAKMKGDDFQDTIGADFQIGRDAANALVDYVGENGKKLAKEYVLKQYRDANVNDPNQGKSDEEIAYLQDLQDKGLIKDNEVNVIDDVVANANEDELNKIKKELQDEKNRTEENARRIAKQYSATEVGSENPFDEIVSEQDSEEGKDIVEGKYPDDVFQKPAELQYAEGQLKKAEIELTASKKALDAKRKELDKGIVEDREDLFGERKSTDATSLFDERVDLNAREETLAPFKQRYENAQKDFAKQTAKVKELQDKGDAQTSLFQKKSVNKEVIDKVVDRIKKALPKVKVVYDEKLKAAGKWSPSTNTITINPFYAGKDTAIHEGGHILIDAMGYNNRIIQAAIKQLRNTPLYAETKQRYPELNEEQLDKEVLAEAIGREGADIFDKVEDRSKFKAYLDYIFDWLKQKLGLDKNVAKSLAKQIIGGVKTKELKGVATGKEQLQKDKKKPFAAQALKYNQYAMEEGFDAQKEFDKYEQATVELREVKEDEKLATIAADEAVTDEEIKAADAELEKQRALLKEASKEFAIKAKRYLGYLKYKKDFRAVQAILEDDNLDEYNIEELNDLITKLFAFNDRAAKSVKERAYQRLGHLVTVKQNEIHKDKEGFIEALGKTSDISPLQSKILHYSQFSEKNADMQALALANGKAIIDKITEANSLKDTHAKLGLKVIQEENKRLGIVGKAANRFSSDSSKYFEWMINEKGDYLTIDEAKAKGLSKAKLDYLDFHRETVAGYRESMSSNDYENVKMGAIRVDKNFREAYKSEGLIPAFSYYLGGGATNLGRVRILHNGKVMSYSEIEKEIIAGVDKKNIKSIAKALYDLLVANIKARYQLKKGQNIDEKDNPLELKGDSEYSLNEKGQLVSKFDKPRAADRGYSKDFYKAMNQFIDESAHVKHISKIMPLVEAIEYLNKNGYMEEGYVPKKNVSKWINDWKALQIFKEPYVNDPVIDAAIKSLRKLVASTTMWFNIPANTINVFVGNYNNWRAENAETLARGNARLFGGKGSRKEIGIVNDYALAIIKKYNLVNQDFDSHPVIKAGSVFSKLATWGTQVGEYQIQGSLGLGLLSQEEFDSFEFTKDKYGNDVLTVKKGVDEDKIKSKMTQVKNRVTDIQGKYPDEDRRNIMRGEFGKALFQFKVWMPDWFKERFSARYFNAYGQEKEGSYTKMLRVGVKEMAADLKKGDIKKALTNPAFVQNLKGMATIGALLALKHGGDDDDDKKKGGLNWDSALSQVLFIFDLEQDKYMVSNPAAILGKIKDMLNAFEALVGFEEDAWQKTKRILPGGKAVTFVENQIK